MLKLDYFAVLIVVAAIVALSLWPLKGHDEGEHEDTGGGQEEHGNAGGHAVHWRTYAGAEGPEHWRDLSLEFAACKSGRMLSPIDIASTASSRTQRARSSTAQFPPDNRPRLILTFV